MNTKHTWKDIVKIQNKITAEEFSIPPAIVKHPKKMQLEFKQAVAKKYHVNVKEIKTYTNDNFNFDAKNLPFGAESCGHNINGKPEWYYEMP